MPLMKLDFTSLVGDVQPMSVQGLVSSNSDTMNSDDAAFRVTFLLWYLALKNVNSCSSRKAR